MAHPDQHGCHPEPVSCFLSSSVQSSLLMQSTSLLSASQIHVEHQCSTYTSDRENANDESPHTKFLLIAMLGYDHLRKRFRSGLVAGFCYNVEDTARIPLSAGTSSLPPQRGRLSVCHRFLLSRNLTPEKDNNLCGLQISVRQMQV